MTWPIITVEEIYDRCLPEWVGRRHNRAAACAWVEAENILAIRALVTTWYDRLKDGTYLDYEPDPLWEPKRPRPPLTVVSVARLLSEMDADFDVELLRTRKPLGAEMSRLPEAQRIAFGQEYWNLALTDAEIAAEAKRRLDSGEALPPGRSPRLPSY